MEIPHGVFRAWVVVQADVKAIESAIRGHIVFAVQFLFSGAAMYRDFG